MTQPLSIEAGEKGSAAQTLSPARPVSLQRTVLGACAGALMEYYDFSIYATLTIYLSLSFFPPDNPAIAVLLAVSSMGVAFVVRPIGGFIFGSLGDRWGRRKIFIVTLFLMSVATIGIGALPGYATLGVAAPILLVGLRVLQGFAVGGEYAAASTYVVEHSPRKKRGYYTGWLASMAGTAIVLALLAVALVQTTMSKADFQAWGWRVPFLLATLLLVVSLVIRRQLSESPVFRELERTGRTARTPLGDILGNWPAAREILAVSIGISAPQVTSGVVGSMLSLYLLQTLTSVDPATSNLLVAAGCISAIPMTVFAGWLSDYRGRRTVQIAGMALGVLFYIPLFHALLASIGNKPLALLIIVALQVPSSLVVGAAFSAIPEIFPAERRATSVAIVSSLGGVIGGLAPAISLWLTNKGGLTLGAAWPVAILLVGMIVNWRWVPSRTGAEIL
ncbi:MAG: MFS transporter [Novosphingobium sp.]|nr:MFS transporter [Novosphingobium sp.]